MMTKSSTSTSGLATSDTSTTILIRTTLESELVNETEAFKTVLASK